MDNRNSVGTDVPDSLPLGPRYNGEHDVRRSVNHARDAHRVFTRQPRARVPAISSFAEEASWPKRNPWNDSRAATAGVFGTRPTCSLAWGPIVDGERDCCRFLQFAISAAQDRGQVILEITGPEGTVAFLESWIGGTR